MRTPPTLRLGFRVLFRNAREIVLGEGPELFIRLRRGRGPARIAETHLAVRDLRSGAASPDALGGDSARVTIGEAVLVLRRFRRAPSPRWRPRRAAPAPASRPRRGRRE
jgi:hypothetical protein